LLYVESSTSVNPKNTGLPPSFGPQLPAGTGVSPTYYFRTHFTFNGSPAAGSTLTFTNFIDDGAVWYLNGAEIYRLRMIPAPNPITYTSLTYPAGVFPCSGDATCPDVFTLPTSQVNLLSGDNVMAAELHQYQANSNDAVFGTALTYTVPGQGSPRLNLIREGSTMTLYWNGSGFTLQRADIPNGGWVDVPGPVTNSAYVFHIPSDLKFFRLRN
jgi:hypothetical protein